MTAGRLLSILVSALSQGSAATGCPDLGCETTSGVLLAVPEIRVVRFGPVNTDVRRR